jgi:hypothetical protein
VSEGTGNGETGKVPDPWPETRLALRVWRYDRAGSLLKSLNAPPSKKPSWVAAALADPAGSWPIGKPLAATCAREHKEGELVPVENCTCGIYAATDLDVIASYLSIGAPVLGVVELGGKVIPATQGYRAAYARVAAILLVDEALTLRHDTLRALAAVYRVPAVVPHSVDPEECRELIGTSSVAREAEDFLRDMGE